MKTLHTTKMMLFFLVPSLMLFSAEAQKNINACEKRLLDLRNDLRIMSNHDRMLLDQMRDRYRGAIQGMNLEVDAAVRAVQNWLVGRPDVKELSRWSLTRERSHSGRRNQETLELDAILNEQLPRTLLSAGFVDHEIVCNSGQKRPMGIPEICLSFPTGMIDLDDLAKSIRKGEIDNRFYMFNLMQVGLTGRALKLPLKEIQHAGLVVNNQFREYYQNVAEDLKPNEIAFYYVLQTKNEMTELPRTLVNNFSTMYTPYFFEFYTAIRFLNLTTGEVRISKEMKQGHLAVFDSNPDLGNARIYASGYTNAKWSLEREVTENSLNCP